MDWKKYYEDTQKFIKKCEEISKTLKEKLDKEQYKYYYCADRWEISKNKVTAYENDENILLFYFDANLLGFSSDELNKYIADEIEKRRLEREKEDEMCKNRQIERRKKLMELSKEELIEKVLHPFG